MKPPEPTEEIPWQLHENLKGIARAMLAGGETPDSGRIRAAMRESQQTLQESERKAHVAWIDQQLASLREAEEEVTNELQDIREKAGLFTKGTGMPDLEKAHRVVNDYNGKRSRHWRIIFYKIFGTLVCSLMLVFIAIDYQQDNMGDHSLLGWLEDRHLFGLSILRPWLFMVVMFLLGKLFFRFFFQLIPRREPASRMKWPYILVCVVGIGATLAGWYLISFAFEMPKKASYPVPAVEAASTQAPPVEKSSRLKKM